MPKFDFPTNTYATPQTVLERLSKLISIYGAPVVEIQRDFKEYHELAVASIMMLAIQKIEQTKYYLRPWEDVDLSVDVRAVSWGIDDDSWQTVDIQVTEYQENSNDLLTIIESKLKNLQAEDSRELVVNIRNHAGIYYPDDIRADVAKLNPKFHSIWLILDDESSALKRHIICVWPSAARHQIAIDLQQEIDAQLPPNYINAKRGAHNKLHGPVGTYEWPLR